MAFIPTPDQFPTWQDWARHVVEVLSDSTEGSSPVVSQQPPIQKILRAAAGAYSLDGKSAEFRIGPFHYKLDVASGTFQLTGQNADLLFSVHGPLAADTGAYALSGSDATLTHQGGLPSGGTAVTTFHSIGLYWLPTDINGNRVVPANETVKLRFKRSTDTAWNAGHDLWYDGRGVGGRPAGEARGSIVHCIPGTSYDIQLGLPQPDGSTVWVVQLNASTWSENFDNRIGTRVATWTGVRKRGADKQVLLIDRSGTPNGYTLYDFTGQNAVADGHNASGDNDVDTYGVRISASYVILRGLKIEGGDYGVYIDAGCTDVVVEQCDISDWGTWIGTTYNLTGPDTAGTVILRGNNERGGIQLSPTPGNTTTKRCVIQRNKIHNPRYGSMPWDFAHPEGANGIMCYSNGGNNVIRYNEIYSTLDGTVTGEPDFAHFFTDGMGSGNDFGFVGGPSHDSDFYGNIIMHCMDDALETEDDGCNVRVWGNYADYTGTAWTSTPMAIGPLYVFRNVYNRSRRNYNQQWGAESDRLNCFKIGDALSDGSGAEAGKRYLYNNTCLQMPPGAGQGPRPLGTAQAVTGSRDTQPVTRTKTRNNILDVAYGGAFQQANGSFNDFDYDTCNANMDMAESHGKDNNAAVYQPGNGPNGFVYPNGRFRLATNSVGHADGEVIPNFSDQFTGAAPDRGAHQDGTADMVFGVTSTTG